MGNHTGHVIFSFFIILATTLNFGFAVGDMSNENHHSLTELVLAISINIIALTLKFGAKSKMDATQLATSLVSCILLISAAFIWHFSTPEEMAINIISIVSLSWGAFLANIASIAILILDSMSNKRFK